MPNFDKTGPAGQGSKTGGQMGSCEGARPSKKSFSGRGQGLGLRQGGRSGSRKGLRGWFGRRGRSSNND